MKKLFSKRSYGLYLITSCLLLFPALIILSLNYIILYQAGELRPIKEMAADLQNNQVIFGSGINDLRREINLEIIRLRKPSIIAFGSSRPLNFRQEYFNAPYACACQAVPNLNDGIEYARNILNIYKPDVVLFSVDFWWFTTESGVRPKALVKDKPQLTLQKLIKPILLAIDHTITPSQFWDLLKSKENDFLNVTTHQKKGLLSITRSMGTRADGSYFGGVRLSDYSYQYYKDWSHNLHNAEDYIYSNDRYGPHKKIIEKNIEQYAKLVKMFQTQNIKVISIMMPLAPTIYDSLKESPDHKHIFELSKKIESFSNEFYDLHNPHIINANICEFEDAHHSGDTVFMKVLQEITDRNPHSALLTYIDKKELDQYIKIYAGKTIATFDEQNYLMKEKDFTQFGCDK